MHAPVGQAATITAVPQACTQPAVPSTALLQRWPARRSHRRGNLRRLGDSSQLRPLLAGYVAVRVSTARHDARGVAPHAGAVAGVQVKAARRGRGRGSRGAVGYAATAGATHAAGATLGAFEHNASRHLVPRVQGRLRCKSGGQEERAHAVALLLAAAGMRVQALTRHLGLRRQSSSTRGRPGTCGAARQTGQQHVQLPFAAGRGMACSTLGSQQSGSEFTALFCTRFANQHPSARGMAQTALQLCGLPMCPPVRSLTQTCTQPGSSSSTSRWQTGR